MKDNEVYFGADTLFLDFYVEAEWIFPRVFLSGLEGTCAQLTGQSMTPDEIINMGEQIIAIGREFKSQRS
jgi:hypothetical protein